MSLCKGEMSQHCLDDAYKSSNKWLAKWPEVPQIVHQAFINVRGLPCSSVYMQ